jgi:hypothetical protein
MIIWRKVVSRHEIRRVPMNQKLTATLDSAKKVSKSQYVFSDNGKPYEDVKTGWWHALKKARIEGLRFHDPPSYLRVKVRNGWG